MTFLLSLVFFFFSIISRYGVLGCYVIFVEQGVFVQYVSGYEVLEYSLIMGIIKDCLLQRRSNSAYKYKEWSSR